MRLYIKLFFQLLLLLGYVQCIAQSGKEDNLVNLQGQVVDSETKEPVPYVSLFNINQKRGTSTDTLGHFSLKVGREDSVLVISLGYERLVYQLDSRSPQGNDQQIVIQLVPKAYELKEVDIHAFRTEEDFKNHILSMDMPVEEKLVIPGLELVKPEPDFGNGEMKFVIPGPITYLTNTFGRRAKEHRKFLAVKEQNERQKKIDKRYNADFVKDITGIQDPQELEEFMSYCTLEEKFLELANDYDLIVAVHHCYDEFSQLRTLKH